MARRTPALARAASRSVADCSGNGLKNIAALIESGGQVSIGKLWPIACAAVANDDHNCLAMLQRRPGESLHELLARLDAAIVNAWNGDCCIDEINPPSRTARRS